MKKKHLDFLMQMLEADSPSGYETPVATVFRKFASSFADEVIKDEHGNTIAVINPKAPYKVMFAGHYDEIGLMVKHIEKNGLIRFAPIGGVDRHVIAGQRVKIITNKGVVYGVIGQKAIHLKKPDERNKLAEFSSMWIDIGAKDKKEVEKAGVMIGDPITIHVKPVKLLNNNYASRAFDDKIGAFVAIMALLTIHENRKKLPKDVGVYAVGTVQEEIGLRGAQTATYKINPNIGIAIDVTHTSDHPGVDKSTVGDIELGKGPVITRGANINRKLFDLLRKTAKKHKIDYQISAAPRATGTDANVIQVTRGGVVTGLIGIPNRYMHTPVEVVNMDDVEGAYKLLANLVLELPKKRDFTQ